MAVLCLVSSTKLEPPGLPPRADCSVQVGFNHRPSDTNQHPAVDCPDSGIDYLSLEAAYSAGKMFNYSMSLRTIDRHLGQRALG